MWMEVMEKNPSYFKGDKRPVEKVTWWSAIKFCNEMSKKYKLEPVYNITYDDFDKPILKINQIGESPVEPDKADFKKTEGFRLPTEVEWEWFARGGEVAIQDGTFDKRYSGSDNPDKVAWHNGNSKEETHEVGTKNPNQLGLYDCSGNVWEWCYDKASCYSASYLREGNKKELIQSGKLYKYDIKESGIRGEAWTYDKDYFSDGSGEMRIDYDNKISINRGGYLTKTYSHYTIGFRIVRTV
jgi:possible ATP-binding protein